MEHIRAVPWGFEDLLGGLLMLVVVVVVVLTVGSSHSGRIGLAACREALSLRLVSS